MFYVELLVCCKKQQKKPNSRNWLLSSLHSIIALSVYPSLQILASPSTYLKRRDTISELFSTQFAMERMGNSFRTSFLENCSCLHIILAENFYYCWKHAAFIFCCLNFQENFENILLKQTLQLNQKFLAQNLGFDDHKNFTLIKLKF